MAASSGQQRLGAMFQEWAVKRGLLICREGGITAMAELRLQRVSVPSGDRLCGLLPFFYKT